MKHKRIDKPTFDEVKKLLAVTKERGWKKEVARLKGMSYSCVGNIAKASSYEEYNQAREDWRLTHRKPKTNGLKPVLFETKSEAMLSSINQTLKEVLAFLVKQENARQEQKRSLWGSFKSPLKAD